MTDLRCIRPTKEAEAHANDHDGSLDIDPRPPASRVTPPVTRSRRSSATSARATRPATRSAARASSSTPARGSRQEGDSARRRRPERRADTEAIYVDRMKDAIKNSPEYDADRFDDPSYRDELCSTTAERLLASRGRRPRGAPPRFAVCGAPPPPPPPPPRSRSPRGRSSRGSRGGRVLRPLDQLLGRDEAPFSCLATSLRPIRPRSLSTSWTITSSTSPRLITSSMWPTRPGPTFETWSRPSVPFFSSTNAPNSVVLTTLPVVLVADLRALRQAVDRGDRGIGLRALGRVDEDRAVLLDVDLHLVVGLERRGSSRRPCRSPCRCTRG